MSKNIFKKIAGVEIPEDRNFKIYGADEPFFDSTLLYSCAFLGNKSQTEEGLSVYLQTINTDNSSNIKFLIGDNLELKPNSITVISVVGKNDDNFMTDILFNTGWMGAVLSRETYGELLYNYHGNYYGTMFLDSINMSSVVIQKRMDASSLMETQSFFHRSAPWLWVNSTTPSLVEYEYMRALRKGDKSCIGRCIKKLYKEEIKISRWCLLD